MNCPPHCYGCYIGHCGDPRYAEIIAQKNTERVGLNLAPAELLGPPPPRRATSRPSRTIRVGLVCPVWLIGGGERWAGHLYRAILGDPFEWTGIAVLDGHRFGLVDSEATPRPDVPVYRGDAGAAELASRVDVLICWGSPTIASVTADATCRRVLVSHGVCGWTRTAVADAAVMDAMVAVSEPAREPFPPDQQHRAVVIRNAVEIGPMRQSRDEIRSQWGIPPGSRVLGYLGRISPEKGPDRFLESLAHLPDEWVGVMAGPYADRVSDAAASLGDRVRLVGPVSCPAEALAAFDCLLMPSREEGLGLAALEAVLAGVPTIMTATGAALETPELFRVCRLDASPADLAQAVLADAADEAGTRARVESARAIVRDRYGFDRFRAEWRQLIEQTAAPHSTEPPPDPKFERQRQLVRDCPHRGEELIKGCNCKFRCRANKGYKLTPDVVTLAECYECAKVAMEA